MVAATRWRQDSRLDPNNPWQTLRTYPAYPGDGGYATFAWSPVALAPAVGPNGNSIMPYGGLTGAPAVPGLSSIAKVFGAIAGLALGGWLAHKNLTVR